MDSVITQIISTHAGRLALARAMTLPARTTRDYDKPCASCKKIFVIDSGVIVNDGGADDGCPECVIRSVIES